MKPMMPMTEECAKESRGKIIAVVRMIALGVEMEAALTVVAAAAVGNFNKDKQT